MDNRKFNEYLDTGNLKAMDSMWQDSNIHPLQVCTREWGIQSIRYLILKGDSINAISLFSKLKLIGQVKKRNVMILIEHLLSLGDQKQSLTLFIDNYADFEFDGSDLGILLLGFDHEILVNDVLPRLNGISAILQLDKISPKVISQYLLEDEKHLKVKKTPFPFTLDGFFSPKN